MAKDLSLGIWANIFRMLKDGNIWTRACTITLVGPTSVFMAAYNKDTCALLILFFFVSGQLEWQRMKRHIKVVVLMEGDASEMTCSLLLAEYAVPVAPHDTATLFRVFFASFVVFAARSGLERFHTMIAVYLLVRAVFTLYNGHRSLTEGQRAGEGLNGHECQRRPASSGNAEHTLQQSFLRMELFCSGKSFTNLSLDLLLECFGFLWVTGVTYPLLIYDVSGTGRPWILASLVSNFAVDIVAMLVGRVLRARSHRLSPLISPNKSVEGAVVGVLISSFIFATILHYTTSVDAVTYWYRPVLNLVVGLLLGVVGVVGDLLQSLLKRTARLKDSGALMPGHGGVLDRIDGLLLVFPAMYCCFCALAAAS
ncbi:putative Cytidylyltransferase family [Trypanosoma vivax]|nr:putative Cytidylyltransferase family [Trypanosoma vivax]